MVPVGRFAIGLYVVLCAAFGLNILFLQPIALRPSLSPPQTSLPRMEDKATVAIKKEKKIEKRETSSLTQTEENTLTSLIEKSLRVPFVRESLSQKDSIRALQNALEAKGYRTGETDGSVGPVTQAAILAFEFDHALPLTGEPQPQLLEKILEGLPREREGKKIDGKPASATAEKIIRSVQQTLYNLGYPIEKVDGQMDEKTSVSIRQFEAQQGMPNTGRISGELVVRLSRLSMRAQKIDVR